MCHSCPWLQHVRHGTERSLSPVSNPVRTPSHQQYATNRYHRLHIHERPKFDRAVLTLPAALSPLPAALSAEEFPTAVSRTRSSRSTKGQTSPHRARTSTKKAAPPQRRISIPVSWLVKPFLSSLRAVVKPATSKTKRRVIEIKCKYPLELFQDFLSPLQEGDVEGLARNEAGDFCPTKSTGTSHHYDYKLKRPLVTDKLFALEKTDQEPGPRTKEPGAWKRGSGGARLNLPLQGHKKGGLATTISMVAGSAHVKLIVPKRERAWPVMTLRFFCLTAARTGSISWPANFSTISRALLRKLVEQKLEAMLSDDTYPTHPSMADALQATGQADSVLALRGPAEPWTKEPRRPQLMAPGVSQ